MPAQIDQLADRVAGFHTQLAPAAAADNYGSPESVSRPVEQTIDRLRKGLVAAQCRDAELTMLDELEAWSRQQYARLKPALAVRKQAGFVRECHGDMHLGNIVWLDDEPLVFDGIEFNPAMRWIDVMNDAAFLVMDLEERGQAGYAQRFLNRYLEGTGDYEGLRFLPFYKNYRALVRAMVACLRAAQEGVAAGEPEMSACAQYLVYAQQASSSKMPWLLLMHGLSGSGKTTVSQHILERTGALRIRSDIERKRLRGLPALARGSAVVNGGIYDEETTRATYLRLVQLACQVLEAGFPVVVDAASLKFWQRDAFRRLAQQQRVPFHLICYRADESTLHQRLRDRERNGVDASDADVAVLRHQQQNCDPLSKSELDGAWSVDDGENFMDRIIRWIETESGG